ncbi:PREDICTED: probable uridine nucleosidase 1 [Nicrophorus vespilloides]|uniref:Probable uridine nucleosidase 1 n=1 Tax=Nicrophorus vespilloides TaxID=110193 RepID=A0ABM1MT76_NICVS|nr:PREDICTED: probable uridine nucleosidase 1 [Nicrophorus vespilloides]
MLYSILFITSLVLCDAALSPRKVIVDVDGGVDDYQALVILMNADKLKIIKIEAILCTKGNTELVHVENNILRLLEAASRTDIPVYSGSYKQIMPIDGGTQRYYGIDGFGDLKHEKQPNRKLLKKVISPTYVFDLLKKYPKQISLVLLGPQTNNAIGFRIYKEYAKYLKEMYIMGGNIRNTEPEFNILVDPEAAEIVFSTTECPIFLLPFETCQETTITNGELLNMTDIISNPVWNLMMKAEAKLMAERPDDPKDKWVSCDPVAALAYLSPKKTIKVLTKRKVSVKLDEPNRGSLIVDNPTTNNSINIIEQIDWNYFMKSFKTSFADICKCGIFRRCVVQNVL